MDSEAIQTQNNAPSDVILLAGISFGLFLIFDIAWLHIPSEPSFDVSKELYLSIVAAIGLIVIPPIFHLLELSKASKSIFGIITLYSIPQGVQICVNLLVPVASIPLLGALLLPNELTLRSAFLLLLASLLISLLLRLLVFQLITPATLYAFLLRGDFRKRAYRKVLDRITRDNYRAFLVDDSIENRATVTRLIAIRVQDELAHEINKGKQANTAKMQGLAALFDIIEANISQSFLEELRGDAITLSRLLETLSIASLRAKALSGMVLESGARVLLRWLEFEIACSQAEPSEQSKSLLKVFSNFVDSGKLNPASWEAFEHKLASPVHKAVAHNISPPSLEDET